MHDLSPTGERFLKNEEGLRLVAYICAAGKLTIGYGHRLYGGALRSITLGQAEAYFKSDVQLVLNELWSVSKWLTQNEIDALVSFIFNIGINAWRGSHARQILSENYSNAGPLAHEMSRWVHDDHGNVIPGLVLRRDAEIKTLMGEAA